MKEADMDHEGVTCPMYMSIKSKGDNYLLTAYTFMICFMEYFYMQIFLFHSMLYFQIKMILTNLFSYDYCKTFMK